MRYAVKVAYDGSLFHGSQRQGEEYGGSVEGTIVKALMDIGQYEKGEKWPISFSSRTDSGVSAMGNVFTVESEMEPDDLLRALNSKMDGIWCWGYGRPRENQNIRWANSRWYRYHLRPDTLTIDELDQLGRAMDMFRGEHDFTKLCRMEDHSNPETYIESTQVIDLSGNGQLVAVDIIGSRFLWQQVRRMVGAAVDAVSGKISLEDISGLLEGKDTSVNYATMPPIGLVLMDVRFKDIDFIISDPAIDHAIRFGGQDAWKASIRVLLDSALRSMQV